ncbi:cyclic nucleotide-binding domain-containing protein [Ilumatobacter sp.]|uniref:cyclic nucleotide-binding domain-containing protein n=1 Tax=Ilumatobacter sp. TaxID=1967498 RepID=UPI003752BEFA
MSKNAYREHMQNVPLLAGLDTKELDEVIDISTDITVPAGRVLIKEGSSVQELIIVIDGNLEVTRNGQHVANIGPGGFAGEMALLTHSTHNATVAASEDSRVLHIEGGAFDVLLKRVPIIAVKMLPIVASRVARPNDHFE